MSLPNDIARCDGLLPKKIVINDAGITMNLWSIDCPMRETCLRYLAMETDNPDSPLGTYSYSAHYHAPSETCPDALTIYP